MALAETARRRQPDPSRWRIHVTDDPDYPFELVLYNPFIEEVPMSPVKLQPGAMRDALAALSEHTRGGQPFTAASLQRRLGISPIIAADRLRGLARLGYADEHEQGGDRPPEYTITEQGKAVLDA